MAKPRAAKKASSTKTAAKSRLTKPRAVKAVAPKAAPPAPIVARGSGPMPIVRPAVAAQRAELAAPRDVGRLLHYGERFGPSKIDIRMLPVQLPVSAAALALCDPGAPKSWRVLDRPVAAGRFRVMLSVARREGAPDRLAALVIHTGQPPIARWTVAHDAGKKKPRSADQLPRVEVTTGWLALVDAADGSPGAIAVPAAAPTIAPVEVPLPDGRTALAVACPNGSYAAYWAVDAADRPVCLVVDLDAFGAKDWKARAT